MPPSSMPVTAYVVMAYVSLDMAYIVMVYIVMAYIVMAFLGAEPTLPAMPRLVDARTTPLPLADTRPLANGEGIEIPEH